MMPGTPSARLTPATNPTIKASPRNSMIISPLGYGALLARSSSSITILASATASRMNLSERSYAFSAARMRAFAASSNLVAASAGALSA